MTMTAKQFDRLQTGDKVRLATGPEEGQHNFPKGSTATFVGFEVHVPGIARPYGIFKVDGLDFTQFLDENDVIKIRGRRKTPEQRLADAMAARRENTEA